MNKRPFFLIEVLVALTLITLCVIPLLRSHFHMLKHDVETARAIEHEMKAQQRFEEIRELFYLNKISWKRSDATIKGSDYTITVPKDQPKGKGENYRKYRLYNINTHGCDFTLFAERVKE